jgi:Na+/H+ antiporter NhaD/arsenite permease-like protein
MIISIIIVLGCFLGVIILIITNKLNRAIAALSGAVIIYFVLVFIEKLDFKVIIDLLFGSEAEGFVNLHSLILIISMMFIVQVSNEAGLFQFFALNLIKLSKGKPIYLMSIFCLITILISAILNNILTVIILIPLTITVSRILNINPSPYILTEAILVNIGGTFFTISSIPNILITTFANISFVDFFLNVGVVSLMIFAFTLIFFIFMFKKALQIPREGIDILKEFNVWNFVPDRKLLFKALIVLFALFAFFIIIPSSFIPIDMVALVMALTLTIICRINPKHIISKIDFELIFYLLGIFVIAGALEVLGVVQFLGEVMASFSGGDVFFEMLIILWFSAFLSSAIDNIPITKVLIPVISTISSSYPSSIGNQFYYSLAIGANWGDNLTPLGDNILVVQIAEQNKRPISFRQFFKIGFITTLYQIIIVSLYYTIIFKPSMGLIIVTLVIIILVVVLLLSRFGPNKMRQSIHKMINKFRNIFVA